MNWIYTIEGNSTLGTRAWIVQSTTGREFSIFNFFGELVLFTDFGLFGFDDFGRALLAIFILVITTGILSLRHGITSEAAIMGFIFGIVFFLDVGVGLIPERITVGDFTSISHFITFIAFIILISIVIREEIR